MQSSASPPTSSRPPLAFIPVSMPSATQLPGPAPFAPLKSEWGKRGQQSQRQTMGYTMGVNLTLRGTSDVHRFDMSVFGPFAKDRAGHRCPTSAPEVPLTWSSDDPCKIEEKRVLQAAEIYSQKVDDVIRNTGFYGNYRATQRVNHKLVRNDALAFPLADTQWQDILKKDDLKIISHETIPWAQFAAFLRRADLYQDNPEETCSPLLRRVGVASTSNSPQKPRVTFDIDTSIAPGDDFKTTLIHQYPVIARLLTFSMGKVNGLHTSREQTPSIPSLWQHNNPHDYSLTFAALI